MLQKQNRNITMSNQKLRILSLALLTVISSGQDVVEVVVAEAEEPPAEPIEVVLPESNVIGTNCIKKHELRGGSNVFGSTEFSDVDFIGRNIDKDMQLYAYYECNDKKTGDLESFQLVLANIKHENKTLLAEVGHSSSKETMIAEVEVEEDNNDDAFPANEGINAETEGEMAQETE